MGNQRTMTGPSQGSKDQDAEDLAGRAERTDQAGRPVSAGRTPGRTGQPRRSPDAEGGQPVDELDLDGDGARSE